jgi:hypothetical protein
MNAFKATKNNANTISNVIDAMTLQQKFRLEIYKNYRELSLGDHEANIANSKTQEVKPDQTTQCSQTTQTTQINKPKIKDYINGLESASRDDREITEALANLKNAATNIHKVGLLSEKEILDNIKSVKTIQDVENTTSSFAKTLEAADINTTLDGFKKHLNKSKISGDISSTLKTLESEQKYLASLYDKLSPGHDPHLLVKVEAAHHAESDNVMDKLHKSIIYAQSHNILSDAEISKKLHNATSNKSTVASAQSEISTICINHSGKTIKEHLHLIESGKIIKFEGHQFCEPKEYLQHWKQTRDHHLIPIQAINKSLTQIRQMEKAHEMGGPSL